MKIILINGEKQIGKSTLARALRDELTRYYTENRFANMDEQVGIYSMVAPLQAVVQQMNPNWRDMSYDEIKSARLIDDPHFQHIDGRDVMIQFGNALRSLSVYILPAMAYQQARYHRDTVMIVENWGMVEEFDYFVHAAVAEQIQIFTIALTEGQTSNTRSGEQYPNDNRFRLDHIAEMVDWGLPEILARVTKDQAFEFKDLIAEWFPQEVARHETLADLVPSELPEEEPLSAEEFESRMAEGTGLKE